MVTAASLVQPRIPKPSAPAAAITLSVGFTAPSAAREENSILKVYFIPNIYIPQQTHPKRSPWWKTHLDPNGSVIAEMSFFFPQKKCHAIKC